MRKKLCSAMTTGKIIDKKDKGFERPIVITVQYMVDGAIYTLRESLKYRSELIKIGFLPIGQIKSPKLENHYVGDVVRVAYDPKRPKRAYLLDNQGIMTS